MRTLRLSLAGTAMLALLGGLSIEVVAQDEEVAPDELPTGPARFEHLTDIPFPIVATDPRMSGRWVKQDEDFLSVPTGNGLMTWRSRLTNDAGAWECWSSGYSYGFETKLYMQRWCVGEDGYEGLSAIMFFSDEAGEVKTHGLIYEGEPLWEPSAE